MPNDGVEVRAYNEHGKLVFEQFVPSYRWYDGDIPLLDDVDEVRVRYHVRHIEGNQYDLSGNLTKKWKNVYNESGTPIQFFTWIENDGGGQWEVSFIEGLDAP